MAEDLDAVNQRLETIELILERTAETSLNASKRMGLFEKQVGKLKVAIKNHPIKGMYDTFKGYAKALGNVTKVTGQHSTMDEEQNYESIQQHPHALCHEIVRVVEHLSHHRFCTRYAVHCF